MKRIVLVLLLFVTIASQAQWTALNGPYGGDITRFKRAPNGSLYTVVNQKLWRSTNNGDLWSEVIPTSPTSLHLNDIMIDSDGKLYAAFWSQLFSSSDNGLTWTTVANNIFQNVQAIDRVGPDNVFVVWGYSGVYVSINKGVAWTQLTTLGSSGTPGLWSNSAGDIFYGIQGGGLLKHSYQALTTNWNATNMTQIFTVAPSTVNAMAIDGTGKIYLSALDKIYTSTNNGTSFTDITTTSGLAPTYTYFNGPMIASPDGSISIFNNSPIKVHKSTNQGASWITTDSPTLTNGGQVNSIVFASASTYFLGTTEGVLRTIDTGANWATKNTGLTGATTEQIVVANTTGKIIAAKFGRGYTSSVDGGATWTTTALPNSGNSSKVLKLANGNILLHGAGQIYRSTDNGVTFTTDNISRNSDNSIIEASNGDLYLFYQAFVSPNWVPKIARSTDSGATWVDMTITGLPASNFNTTVAAIDGTTNILIHGYDGNTASYKTFKLVGTAATQLIVPFTFNLNNLFFQNNRFYASQFSAYYYTTDLGTTWTTVGFSGNKVFPIRNATYSGIAVSRPGSLYISQDEGGTWSNTTLPTATGYITNIAADAAGSFYASASGAPVLKFTSPLLVDPATLPPYINFNWQPLKGPYGGVINKVQTSPDGNTLFALVGSPGSNGRLWKFTNGSWSQIDPVSLNGGIWDVEVDGSGAVYALANINPQRIYKSTDLGVTWSPLTSTGLPATISNIRRIEVLSNGSILAFGTDTSLGRIYKLSDNGASFTLQFTSAFNQAYGRIPAVSPTGGGGTVAIFGLPSEGMVVSTDFGTTWTVKSTASVVSPTNGFVGSYMYDKDGNLLMHAIFNTTMSPWANEIVKSSDNGTTWTVLPTPNIPIPNSTQIYSKRIIALGTGEYLMCIQSRFDCYRSTDGGATWTNIGNVGDVFVWAATQGTTSYILGSGDAGILKTTDGGLTFSVFSNGIPHPNANEIVLLNNKDLIVGATRPYYSSDFGQNFTLAILQPASKYLLVGDSIIGYGGNRRMLKSKDAGKTWVEFGADALFYTFLTKDATGTGFYGSNGRSLNYSTNLITWTNIVLSGLPANYNITSMVIDQGGVIYAVVFDSGTSTTDVYKIVFGSATKISTAIGTTSPSNILYVNNKIYLYDKRGIVYKSTDGEIWTQGSAPAGNSLVVANNYLFIPASNSVLWLSRNDGGTWQSVGDTPPTSGLIPVFRNVVINEFDGYAYATLSNSVARKSANIVIPNDNTKPVATAYLPLNNATNIGLRPTLTITFDEITRSVTGKKIRIFDVANQAIPVETIDLSAAVQNYKSWSVTPTAALSFNKTYFIVIESGAVTDIFGNTYLGISSVTTWRFTTKSSPTVSTLSPANAGTNTVLNSTFAVTFSESVSGATGKNLSLYKTASPSTVVASLPASSGVVSGSQTSFTFPTATLEFNTPYFIKFDASSFTTADGGTFSALTQNTDWTFTTRAAPTVTTLTPANNSTGIALATTLVLTFSEPLTQVASKNIGIYKVSQPATAVTTVAITSGVISGNTITFTLANPLEYLTQYFVTLDDGAFRSSDGISLNLLNTNTSWRFTTKSSPTVSTLSPANAATSVALNSPFVVTFSESVSGATGKNLSLYKTASPSTAVASLAASSGVVSGNQTSFTFPTATLEFNTPYFIKFDASSFTTADGATFSALTQNTDWTFTTIEAPDSQKPTIVFTTSNLEKGAAKTIEVTVTDNKPLPTNKTKIYYRKITDIASVAFTSEPMTAGAGSGTVSSKFTISANEAWYSDLMGMEFYFETEDAAGNKERSPTAADTYHYSYIEYKTSAVYPDLPSSRLSFGGAASNYRMISVPYSLSDDKVLTILNELGNVDKTKWRIFTYAGNNQFTENPSSVTRGKGYWINIKSNPGEVKIEGSTSPSNNRTSFFKLTLNSGWNQIGNPYPIPISWEQARAGNTGIGKLKVFNGSAYADGDILQPFEGGFVNNTGSNVEITIRFQNITSGGRIESEEIGRDLSAPNWVVPIAALNNEIENTIGGIGMHQYAKQGWDEYDDMNPPRFLDAAELSFVKKNEDVKKLAKDVVPTREEYVWDLNVETSDGLTTLRWDNENIITNGKELMLLDVLRNKLVDMKSEGSYAFQSKEGNSFKIYYGINLRDKIKPTAITLGKPYPNPMSGESTILFTLPEKQVSYQTKLEVYNALGQRVTTLAEGNFIAGFYTTKWNNENSSGGIYFFRLTVAEDGVQKVLTEKVIVNR